jgi:hypothetical protein
MRPATLLPYLGVNIDLGQWLCVPFFRDGLPLSGDLVTREMGVTTMDSSCSSWLT